jgi:hypothetical protein
MPEASDKRLDKATKSMNDLDPDARQELVNLYLKKKENEDFIKSNPLQSRIDDSNSKRADSNYGLINPDPSSDVPLSNPMEASPWDQSQLGQAINSIPANNQNPQDIANENIARTFPQEGNKRDIASKQEVQSQNAQIPQDLTNSIMGPELTKLTSPNSGIQIPMRPDELAALPSDTSNDRTPESDLADLNQSNPKSPVKAGSIPSSPKSEEQKLIDTSIATPPSNPDDFAKQLQDARERDQQHQLMFGMMKASQQFGSALGQASKPADTSYADSELAKENQQANRVKTDMDMKEEHQNIMDKNKLRDPKSAVSIAMHDALSGMGIKIPPNTSYQEMEKFAPQLMKNKEFQMKLEEMRLKREEMHINKQNLLDSKLSDKEQKKMDNISKGLTSYRGDPAAGKASDALRRAEMAGRLLDKPKWSTEERSMFAGEMSALIKGGVPTEHELKTVLPDTSIARFKKAMEFVTNHTQDVEDARYKEQMKSYLKELKDINQSYLDNRSAKIISMGGYNSLSKEAKDVIKAREPSAIDILEPGKSKTKEVSSEPTKPKSKTVTQNGHTYTLNEATGKYE